MQEISRRRRATPRQDFHKFLKGRGRTKSKVPVVIGLGTLYTLIYTYTFRAGITPRVEVYAHYYGGNRWIRE